MFLSDFSCSIFRQHIGCLVFNGQIGLQRFFSRTGLGFSSDGLDLRWFFHGQFWFSLGLDFSVFRSDWTGFSSDGFGFLLRIVSSRFFG